MKSKAIIILLILGISAFAMLAPQVLVRAQGNCGVDSTGNPIPCPTEPGGGVNRKPTITLPPPTSTPTATFTQTATPPPAATASPTVPSPTITVTPTATEPAFPSNPSTSWLPGIGIGAFLLLIVVTIFLPAVQKVRVTKRGY